MASGTRRIRWKVRTGLIGGVAMLLLVDIIWVGSAGLTRVKVTFDNPLPYLYYTSTPTCSIFSPWNLTRSHSSRHTLRPLSFPSISWRFFSGVHGSDSAGGRCADVERREKQLLLLKLRGTVQHLGNQLPVKINRMLLLLNTGRISKR